MQGRLSVGIIGAGPVGTVLGQALAAAGHYIVGIAATDEKNIERAEILLPDVPIKTLPAILEEADLVLLAIPADQIAPTVNGIAQNSMWRSGQLVAHTAGQFGYNILGPATAQGVIPLAIHPAMTFTGTSIDLSRIRESFFAVAAPVVALPIGGEPVLGDDRESGHRLARRNRRRRCPRSDRADHSQRGRTGPSQGASATRPG